MLNASQDQYTYCLSHIKFAVTQVAHPLLMGGFSKVNVQLMISGKRLNIY